MNDESLTLDHFDRKILDCLQRDSAVSQRVLADRVGLSQNACWRRLQRLEKIGILRGQRAEIDLAKLGIDLIVIVFVKTPNHSREWTAAFRSHVEKIAGVVDFYRIGGEVDYLIKVMTTSIAGYDRFYQELVDGFDLSSVTGHFVMERMIDGRPLRLV